MTPDRGDVVYGSLGLLVLSPFLALVALLIALESRGPVIFKQARRGFNGETFMIWKFRSMYLDAEARTVRREVVLARIRLQLVPVPGTNRVLEREATFRRAVQTRSSSEREA